MLSVKKKKERITTHNALQQQAASTVVFCATAPELEGVTGGYFNNCYRCQPSNPALNLALAARLWTFSQDMITDILKKNVDNYKD